MTYRPVDSRYQSMPYRRAGRSGLLLPPISLGLWQNFGGHDPLERSRDIVHRAFDLGVTHFDLANNYGPPYGSAETTFGKILSGDLGAYRDELIISTKAGYDMWPGPYGNFGSRKYLLASLDQNRPATCRLDDAVAVDAQKILNLVRRQATERGRQSGHEQERNSVRQAERAGTLPNASVQINAVWQQPKKGTDAKRGVVPVQFAEIRDAMEHIGDGVQKRVETPGRADARLGGEKRPLGGGDGVTTDAPLMGVTPTLGINGERRNLDGVRERRLVSMPGAFLLGMAASVVSVVPEKGGVVHSGVTEADPTNQNSATEAGEAGLGV